MTATPTPLRERFPPNFYVIDWRARADHCENDGDTWAANIFRRCAEELESALSARDEAGAVAVAAILAALNVKPIGQFYPGHTAAESEQANEAYYGKERREQVFAEIARLREVERRCWHLLDDAGDDGESISFNRNSPDYRRLDELLPEECPGCGVIATPPASGEAGFEVTVNPVVVQDAPDACFVRLTIGAQTFNVGPDYHDTREDGEWFAEQLRIALRRLAAVAPAGMVLVPKAQLEEWHRTLNIAPTHIKREISTLLAAPTPPATAEKE